MAAVARVGEVLTVREISAVGFGLRVAATLFEKVEVFTVREYSVPARGISTVSFGLRVAPSLFDKLEVLTVREQAVSVAVRDTTDASFGL